MAFSQPTRPVAEQVPVLAARLVRRLAKSICFEDYVSGGDNYMTEDCMREARNIPIRQRLKEQNEALMRLSVGMPAVTKTGTMRTMPGAACRISEVTNCSTPCTKHSRSTLSSRLPILGQAVLQLACQEIRARRSHAKLLKAPAAPCGRQPQGRSGHSKLLFVSCEAAGRQATAQSCDAI